MRERSRGALDLRLFAAEQRVVDGQRSSFAEGVAGDWRKPVVQLDFALKLAALTEARDNGRDDQLLRVGVHMGIQAHASGIHAGSDIRGPFGMHGAVHAKLPALSLPVKIKAGDAFGGVWVAGE